MAKTKKKIDTVETIPTVGKDQIDLLAGGFNFSEKEIEVVVGDVIVKIMVRPRISLAERSLMVEEIADFCFVDEMYVPYMATFARIISVLNHFTNIDVGTIDMEQAYRLTKNHEMYRAIYSVIDDDVASIFADANTLIEWRKEKLMKSTKADELYDTMIRFVISLEDALDRMADNVDPAFNGISVKSIVDAVTTLSKKDEKELAHAVLDYQKAQKKQAEKKTSTKKKASPATDKE